MKTILNHETHEKDKTRFPFSCSSWLKQNRKPKIAFTLIELLVVIAIIAVLAAILIPAGGIVIRKENLGRAMSERDQLETAIEAYHSKYGFYPPGNGNAGIYITNQLYYELMGTTNTANGFTTLDGASTPITASAVSSVFGVQAFMNCSKSNSTAEDSTPAVQFLGGLKSGEIASANIASGGSWSMIVTAANSDPGYQPLPGVNSLAGHPANPWRYMYPGTNNPGSYDLWVQIYSGGKTNLICNWNKQVQYNVAIQ